MPKHCSIADAYAILGLEEGSSLELVKTTYRQRALQTHPDKNPNNTGATAEFQQVSEAYRVLLKHLERSSRDEHNPYDYPSDFEDFDWDDGYNSDDFPDVSRLYEALFELFMRGEMHSHLRFRRPRSPSESPKQFQERIRRACDDQLAAQERRKRETAVRKENAEREREQERIAAEARHKIKLENKRSQAQSQRQKAEKAARAQQQKVQVTRSAAFAAARAGDVLNVKKAIWEDAADASGGEVKAGCQDFVKSIPKDPKETLLHIAARNGDLDLVKWLDGHGAEPEERDSEGLSPFHISLRCGHVAISAYFIETYPPDADSMQIYEPPQPLTLLSIAIRSCEPELVWMILDKGLATSQDMSNAWAQVSSSDGTLPPTEKTPIKHVVDDIKRLLIRFGGFTSPPPPKPSYHSGGRKNQQQTLYPPSQPSVSANRVDSASRGRGRGHGRGRGRGRVQPTNAAR